MRRDMKLENPPIAFLNISLVRTVRIIILVSFSTEAKEV